MAEEKLRFLLKSSPDAHVTVVAPEFGEATLELTKGSDVTCIADVYDRRYLKGKHLVIAATNERKVNETVFSDCRAVDKLVNVADNPPFCDFYLGGIVTKGQLKVAISTNGKSPTTAKRLRQFFEEVIPEDIDTMVANLNAYRKTLKTDFGGKVARMNQITQDLLPDKS